MWLDLLGHSVLGSDMGSVRGLPASDLVGASETSGQAQGTRQKLDIYLGDRPVVLGPTL